MRNGIFTKAFRTALFAMLFVVMLSAAGCKRTDETDNKPTQKVTQSPEVTPEATPTPTPSPTPTLSPTPTPIPTVQDAFEATDDEGVYLKKDVITGVYSCDVYAVGDRLIFVKELKNEDDAETDDEYLGDDPGTYEEDTDGDPEDVTDVEDEDGDGEGDPGDYSSLYGYDALYLASYDPTTGDMIEKAIEGWDYMTWSIETYPDGTFSLGGDTREEIFIFDSRLNELENIPVAAHFNWRISKDADKVWLVNEGVLNCYDIAKGELTETDILGDYQASYFIDTPEDNEITGISAYIISGDGDYLYKNVYFNNETGAYLGETDTEIRYLHSPDLTRAIRIQTSLPYKIEVFECSPDNLFPGEPAFDPETGEELPPANEAVCTLRIQNTSETDRLLVDWDRDLVLTSALYSGVNTFIYENICYSLQTGEMVSNYIKNRYANYPYYTFDPERGLLYVLFNNDGNVDTYAWDYSADTVRDYRDSFGKFSDIPEEIEQKRREMEGKYGFYFYIGSEIAAGSFGYNLEVFTDYDIVKERLDTIDEVLSIYPEGFFEQFKYGGIKTLSIYLCGTISRKPDVANTIDDAIALANVNRFERALALDLNWGYCLKRTIVHELSHWIDGRIDSVGELGGYADYDDEWLNVNPDDFSYKYSYTSGRTIWKYIYSYDGSNENTYFIDSYSQTYPTEDRARLFEYLMYWDDSDSDMTDYLQIPHLQDKLDFYFKTIRKCFDTTNWPEQTIWEEKLAEKMAAREEAEAALENAEENQTE